jgi:hypothetical protein
MIFYHYFLINKFKIQTNNPPPPPNKVFSHLSQVRPVSSICHTLIVKWGLDIIWGSFSASWPHKKVKKQRSHDQWLLLEQILTQWWPSVTPIEALNLLVQAMHAVTYRHIIMAIKTASKIDLFFHPRLFACHPDGHWGDTEQVVAQWWRPVASVIALDMLHLAVRFVLHRRTAMAIETASRQGTFAHCHLLFLWHYS